MNLISAMDGYLTRRSEGGRARSDHWPSDISNCTRQLWWKWKGEPYEGTTDPTLEWKFALGNAVEDFVAEFLAGAGIPIARKVKGKKHVEGLEHKISYELDGIISDEVGRAGLEVKSSFGYGITKIKQRGYPDQSHAEQVTMYMELEELDRFYVIYVARDSSYRTAFFVEKLEIVEEGSGKAFTIFINGHPTKLNFDTLKARLIRLEGFLERDELAPRDFQAAIKYSEIRRRFVKDGRPYQSHFRCLSCPFQQKCWSEELEKYKVGENSIDVEANREKLAED